MDTANSFKVNKIRAVQSNIQYAALFLPDRVLFIQIGGQFADMRYILSFAVIVLSLAVFGSQVGIYIMGPDGGKLGLWGGVIIGGVIGNQVIKAIKRSRGEDDKLKKIHETLQVTSPDEMLMKNKHNFSIPYAEISAVEMKASSGGINGPRAGTLVIHARNKTALDIAPGQSFEKCRSIVSSRLPDKLK